MSDTTEKGEPRIDIDECAHEHIRQVSEYDVECLDCGVISA